MRTMKYWALTVTAAAALALAGCGGGGGSVSAPTPKNLMVDFTVPDAFQPAAGTYEIAAGGNMVVNGVQYNCSGPVACRIIVDADGDAAYLGGSVTAEPSPSLAAYNMSQANLDMANQDLMDRQGELDTANQNLMDRQGELDTANQNLMDRQGELDTANQNLMDKQGELDTANQNLMDRQTALDAAQQRVNDLVDSGEATQGELDTANQNLMDRQGELDTANQNLMDRQGELDTANQNLMDKQGELDTATGDVTRLEGELDTATGDVTRLEGELATANADIMQLKRLLDTARQLPERAKIRDALVKLRIAVDAVDAGSDITDVNAADDALTAAYQAIADANYLPQDEKDLRTANVNTYAGDLAVNKVARTTSIAAVTKETVIAAEATQMDDAGLGGSAVTVTGEDAGAYTLSVKYGETSITVEGDTDANDEEFKHSANFGGGSTMFTRMMRVDDDGDVVEEGGDLVEEVVIVTSDIKPPTPTAFKTRYPFDANPATTGRTDHQSLNIVAENLGMVMAVSFTAPAGTVGDTILSFQQAMVDDTTSPDVDESETAAMIAGTFDGAMGTYTCTANVACTVTVNTMGVVSEVSGNGHWIFTPEDGETVDVADANYLRYGFWLQKTTDEAGVLTYDEVQTFADAIGHGESASTQAVLGEATYTGSATGVYVHHVYSRGGGSIKSSTSGHFTANASLTAKFGGDAVAVNQQQRLSGTINKFALQHNEENDWSVALQSVGPDSDGTLAGTANGGVTGSDGSFTATYYGTVDAETTPAAVVGEFNAGFSNGSVAGAFGANNDD